MKSVVHEGYETEVFIEGLGVFVYRTHLDSMDSDLPGLFPRPTQGVQQKMLAQSSAARAVIHGKTPEMHNGYGKRFREFLTRCGRHEARLNGAI